LVAKFKIPRWLHCGFQESCEFGVRKTKWSEKSLLPHIHEKIPSCNVLQVLNEDVWKALAELSHFYKQLRAKEIKKEMVEKLEKEILVLIYKLEKIFPPG
jgi:hypothetical protein